MAATATLRNNIKMQEKKVNKANKNPAITSNIKYVIHPSWAPLILKNFFGKPLCFKTYSVQNIASTKGGIGFSTMKLFNFVTDVLYDSSVITFKTELTMFSEVRSNFCRISPEPDLANKNAFLICSAKNGIIRAGTRPHVVSVILFKPP